MKGANLSSLITASLMSEWQNQQVLKKSQAFEFMSALSHKMAQLQPSISNFSTSLKPAYNLAEIYQLQQNLATAYQTDVINEHDIKQEVEHSLPDSYSEESAQSDIFLESSYSSDSTSTPDINASNNAFESFLNRKTSSFIWNLLHIDFEDGISNDMIEEVRQYLHENKYVTICWIYSLFSQNQKNQNILAALLRIVAMTIHVDNADKLLPLVIAGLHQPSSKTQEAALAVIEEWRTEPCLHALQNLEAHSNWIKKYATIVKRELEEELNAN